MKKNVFAILAIGMLLLSSFAFAPVITGAPPQQPSDGDILYVGGSGSGNYSNIQDAINASSNGDTVFVYNGTYYENIIVNKTVNLLGESTKDTIIDGSGFGNAVNITVDYVNLSNFTIKGGTSSIRESSDFTEDFEEGVMPPTGWSTIDTNPTRNWVIINATTYPDFVHSGEYAAWVNYDNVSSSDEYLISPDLDLTGYTNVTLVFWAISNTNFPGATMELHIQGDGFDDVIWDMIQDETWNDFIYRELTFDLSSYVGETINISWRYVGFDGQSFGLDDIVVSFSGLIEKAAGIVINSDNNSITCCDFKENNYGIYNEQQYVDNTIYHNNFIDNVQNAYDNGTNIWDNGTEGNYWDDYTGEDNDGDGIGDTPYDIPGGSNQDLYPLMDPYGEEEEPPEVIITIEEERPQNNTSNVGIDLSNVSVYASIDYDPWPSLLTADEGAYCEIGGDNITTTISTAYFPGRKEAPVDDENPLEYGTTYTWYVNVSLSLTNVHVWRNETFCFTTEGYNEPPVANYNYSINDLTVTFNASSSYDPDGDIENYTWDFGDGNHSYGVVTSHTYETDGNYIVTLTVTDNDSATDTMQKYVDLINYAPIADFDYFIDGKTVSFDASNSSDENGTIVSYYWEFGDGSNGTGINPKHEYVKDYMTYNVTLTVTDSGGNSSNISKDVVIGDATKPTLEIVKPIRALYINDMYKIQRIRMPLIIGDITIAVNATDENGSGIKQVNFIIDAFRPFAKQEGNATEPNDDDLYTWTWEKNVMFRLLHIHIIKVEVIDNAGNINSQTILVRRFL